MQENDTAGYKQRNPKFKIHVKSIAMGPRVWAILFLEIESWNEKKGRSRQWKNSNTIYLVEFHSNKKQNITPLTSGEYILIFSWIGVYITLYLYGKED